MEEFVPNTERRGRLAVMKDVPSMYIQEEFVEGTVHHGQKRLACMKDVPIMRRKEEHVSDMVPST